MRSTVSLTLVLLAALAFSSLPAIAQGPGHGMGMGPYDVKSEVTIAGTVQAVQEHPGRGNHVGIHLLLKTKDSTLDVHVGPSRYIDKQGFRFSEGDAVEVIGSMTKTKDAILAKIIKKDGKSLTLRDEGGKPLWAGKPGSS